ncbi:MAG: pyridoxal-phosphate dependent enzyme [Steroidobacteraceae bacterium]|nr:pyridoxal-phosphate dependent enzyme [Steroidobacteraceae bacterium]MDW8259723.1 pyridoxal-phosphate dependent enzyme [Gammaproteobacteria bacterium]
MIGRPALDLPDFAAVVAAAGRIAPYVAPTPVVNSANFDRRVGRRVWFKCENLQRGHAFKIRGALNAVLLRPPQVRCVATHSSGNHGTALALAAAQAGLRCIVVMPQDASPSKLAAVRAAGATVVTSAPGIAARAAALEEVLRAEPHAHVVHPYDDARVIAGQGTAALEFLSAKPRLQALIVPVGGGGLIGGSALAVRAMRGARCRVIGAEPAAANDAQRALRTGQRQPLEVPATIADGLRGALGERNFALLRAAVDDIVAVGEDEIVAAMRIVLEDLKLLIEPSAAVAVAAVLQGRWDCDDIGVILSGGNVDLRQCPFLAGLKRP